MLNTRRVGKALALTSDFPLLARKEAANFSSHLLRSLFQGYSYSVFNLVYETNVASCRIWDALGFKRIGRIKSCGNLRSYPEGLVDAIIYGRDLGPEGEDYVSEERFDKIRFYLKHGKYPNGADRAEKSRLRSAATHYKLLPAEKGREGEEDAERLMLRDKEVVSDPQRQYEIARQVHVSGQHGGINKTTATIAEKFHWVRIKETVSLVIKNCPDCKDSAAKLPNPGRAGVSNGSDNAFNPSAAISSTGQSVSTRSNPHLQPQTSAADTAMYDRLVDFAQTTNNHPDSQNPAARTSLGSNSGSGGDSGNGRAPMAHMGPLPSGSLSQYAGIPLDPQIMATHSQQQSQTSYQTHQMHDQSPRRQQQQQQQQRPQENQFYGQHPHPTQLSPSSHSDYNPQNMHGHVDPQKQSEDESQFGIGNDTQDMGSSLGRLAAYNSRASDSVGDVGGGGVDAQFDVDMGNAGAGTTASAATGATAGSQLEQGSQSGDDTRLATDRHLRQGDDPLGTR